MDIEIAGKTIAPGQNVQLALNIARLPTRTQIDIPVFVSRGKEDGPSLLLMAGLHGDELNGVEVMRRILDKGHNHPTRGTIVAIPLFNVFGFTNTMRGVPDGKDINRCFPGSKHGSLASAMAWHLTREILPYVDIALDFHTGGASRTNFPQLRCRLDDEYTVQLADAFHAPFTVEAPHRPRSLRQVAGMMGKPMLLFEGGESMRFDEHSIREAIKGTKRLMQFLGMREKSPKPRQESIIIRKRSWHRARGAGLWHSEVLSGQKVKRKERLGYVSDPFGDMRIDIRANYDGYVIGLNNNPVVNRGDALVHLGI